MLLASCCAQLFAPLFFVRFFFREVFFKRENADEPHATGKAARVHATFAAPARQVVRRDAGTRSSLFRGDEEGAVNDEFVEHAEGRKQ